MILFLAYFVVIIVVLCQRSIDRGIDRYLFGIDRDIGRLSAAVYVSTDILGDVMMKYRSSIGGVSVKYR